jgi:hydroxyacylglutathione hydrolase
MIFKNSNYTIVQIPVRADNYIYLWHDLLSLKTFCIDPAEVAEVNEALEKMNWKLDGILITHHHNDHINGIDGLVSRWACPVYGPSYEQAKIPGLTHLLNAGDTLKCGEFDAEILHLPGHTLGHIAYHFKQLRLIFIGDVLFSLGCGRLFEGSFEMMFETLKIIKSLDPATLIFCTHEYTLKNCEFALALDPSNPLLLKKMEWILERRKQNLSTVPMVLGDELLINPFLTASNLATFTDYRQKRNVF